ncbi:MAG TPA: DUF4190 domain-containing protein [Kofleriaceae bacterium]|nr:DUF4190 domain-containing protein [Kofleriaceae bacterium]
MVTPNFPPMPAAPAPRQGNGLAVAGMVLGILAIVLFFLSLFDIVIALLAIIFSIIGLRKAGRVGVGKGMAIAGLVTGILGLILSVLLVVAIAIPAFTDYMKKSKVTEASLQLDRLGKDAKRYFGENGEFPKGSAPLTPAKDCCGQHGDNKCVTTSADWQGVWQQLDFFVDEPTNYRFSYESDGKTFVAKAVGDLDCDGDPGVYELDGSIDPAGNPVTHLIKPPPDKY